MLSARTIKRTGQMQRHRWRTRAPRVKSVARYSRSVNALTRHCFPRVDFGFGCCGGEVGDERGRERRRAGARGLDGEGAHGTARAEGACESARTVLSTGKTRSYDGSSQRSSRKVTARVGLAA
eukprot:4721556-Pleurochrysis_carterae.AAC.3